MQTIKLLATLVIVVLLTACGYKPSSHFVPQVIGKKVYTEVDVSLSDPENSVLIKDALNRALYSRLRSLASSKEEAESTIRISYRSIDFIPLQYDRNGYVVYYQANIRLKFEFLNEAKKCEKIITGRYEFPIRPSAIISNSLRFQALKKGSAQALDQFIAHISAKGLMKHEE